jgi:hypothetical protein
MGRAARAWVSMFCFAFVASSCGGSDFTADESGGGGAGGAGAFDAGSDASSGGQAGAASGGQSGSAAGGQAGADAGNACDMTLTGNTCNEVTTGDATCDSCGRQHCCAEVETCLGNADCRRLMACFVTSCKNQEPVSCGASACSACLQQVLMFTSVSSCLQTNCNAECPFKAN